MYIYVLDLHLDCRINEAAFAKSLDININFTQSETNWKEFAQRHHAHSISVFINVCVCVCGNVSIHVCFVQFIIAMHRGGIQGEIARWLLLAAVGK